MRLAIVFLAVLVTGCSSVKLERDGSGVVVRVVDGRQSWDVVTPDRALLIEKGLAGPRTITIKEDPRPPVSSYPDREIAGALRVLDGAMRLASSPGDWAALQRAFIRVARACELHRRGIRGGDSPDVIPGSTQSTHRDASAEKLGGYDGAMREFNDLMNGKDK